MASDQDFVKFVTDQIDEACDISRRYMFGGCTLYSKGKVVALICDEQLFVKPTAAGRSFIGEVIESPAYEGARPSFLIEDREWLSELITLTERELPKPKARKKSKR